MEDIQNRIIVNMDLNLRAVTSARFMQGNVSSACLECHISNGAKVINIQGESIVFKFEKSDGNYVYQDVTTGVTIRSDLGINVVECVLMANTISVTGTVICEIFRSINGDTNSLPKFLFAVESSMEQGILSSNYIASIDTKLVDWQTSFDQIQADYNAAIVLNGQHSADYNAAMIIDEQYSADYQAAIVLDGQHSELEMVASRKGFDTLPDKIGAMDGISALATSAINWLIAPFYGDYGNIGIEQFMENVTLRGDKNSADYIALQAKYLARGIIIQ